MLWTQRADLETGKMSTLHNSPGGLALSPQAMKHLPVKGMSVVEPDLSES